MRQLLLPHGNRFVPYVTGFPYWQLESVPNKCAMLLKSRNKLWHMLCKHHHGEILTNFSLNPVAFLLKDKRGMLSSLSLFWAGMWMICLKSSEHLSSSASLSAIFEDHCKLPAIVLVPWQIAWFSIKTDRKKVMAKQVTIIHQLHEILHISLKNKWEVYVTVWKTLLHWSK